MNTRVQQAVRRLEQQIMAGRFRASGKLPPEPELAEDLGVSRGTLREAVGQLEARGFVSREQGRGTYVSRSGNVNVRIELDFNESVTRNIAAGGYTPGTTGLTVAMIEPPEPVASMLSLEAQDRKVIEVRRTRTADGIPITHSVDYLVPLGGVLTSDSDFSGSLYGLLAKTHGAAVSLGYAKIEAAVADQDLAERLGVDEGHLLMALKQVHMLADAKPVMYSAVYHRNDLVDIHVARINAPGATSTEWEGPVGTEATEGKGKTWRNPRRP